MRRSCQCRVDAMETQGRLHREGRQKGNGIKLYTSVNKPNRNVQFISSCSGSLIWAMSRWCICALILSYQLEIHSSLPIARRTALEHHVGPDGTPKATTITSQPSSWVLEWIPRYRRSLLLHVAGSFPVPQVFGFKPTSRSGTQELLVTRSTEKIPI